ncbi:MAG: hypothetical protein ACRELB_24860, partial [Polyangiaceae bacterium]
MDATKKGLLAFVQQMGMVALSELLAREAAMIARRAGTSRAVPIITGALAPRRSASAAITCRCRIR